MPGGGDVKGGKRPGVSGPLGRPGDSHKSDDEQVRSLRPKTHTAGSYLVLNSLGSGGSDRSTPGRVAQATGARE